MHKILIIEDDDLIRENLEELFTNENFQVTIAENGIDGIKTARLILPDLIISDIMMPDITGFEVYKALIQDTHLSLIPFIFLSALNDKSNIREGMSLGADDFITKPFLNSELLSVAKNRIEKSKKSKNLLETLKLSIAKSIPHEFFTPLNAILGFSQIIIDECSEAGLDLNREEISKYSKNINEAGNKLLRIIKNYSFFTELVLSSNDSNFISKNNQEVSENIKEIIEGFILSYAKKFSRDSDLVFTIENSNLLIKKEYFLKVLNEIIDNSIKFSKLGTPLKIKGTQLKDRYKLEISDKGIGMTLEQILSIDSFLQFDRNIHEQAGIGLGIYIVQKILEIQKAEIIFENQIDGGLKIILLFPLAQ